MNENNLQRFYNYLCAVVRESCSMICVTLTISVLCTGKSGKEKAVTNKRVKEWY